MIPIKILCACGQKYAFDVEPVNGRMPHPVNCPVCGADGTAATNEIIARSLPPPRPTGLGINRPAATHAATVAAPAVPQAPSPADEVLPKKKRGLLVPVLAGVFLVLAVVGGLLAWKFFGPLDKLAPLPNDSLPHTFAELNAWYVEPPEGQNAAKIFQHAFDGIQITDADRNSAILPLIGKGKLPAPGAPLSAATKNALDGFLGSNDYKSVGKFLLQGAKLEQSRYPIDLTQGDGTLLPHLAKIKQAAQVAELYAYLQAENNQPYSGAEFVTDILKLGESLAQEPVLISQLTRSSCQGMAAQSLEPVLNRVAMPPETLDQLKTVFDAAAANVEAGDGYTRAIVAERVQVYSTFGQPKNKLMERFLNPNGNGAEPGALAKSAISSKLRHLSSEWPFFEETFEKVLAARKNPFPDRLQADELFKQRINDAMKQKMLGAALFDGALGGLAAKEADGLAHLRLAQTAIALERYRADHNNEYAGSLSDLVPKYLSAAPENPFDGTHLNYTKRASGYELSVTVTDGKPLIKFTVVKPPKAMAGTAQTAQSAADGQANYLKGIKEQISLPPEITAFITAKEQLAKDLAQKDGFEVDVDFKNFFAAAKAGRAREAEQLLLAIKKNSYGTNLTPALKSPLPQIAVDVALGYEAFAKADADLVLALGNDLMNSLPAGCIYFGGTDVGRGLPTLLCQAPGDPIFVISQNPLADSRYRQYLRELYGTHIQLPDTNEVQQIVDTFTADLQRRSDHDAKFPGEPKQLRPGESIRMVDGKPRMNGYIAIMDCNALVVKSIFDKNPDREFYYEASSPMDWMYPLLSPHDAILKLNRQPLPVIPADDLKADAAYWSAKVAQLKGNPKFKGDDYVGKAYAHLRSSIAGLYAWRVRSAKDANERERMLAAATNAFRQALTLDATLPEAVYGMVNVDMLEGRTDAALTLAKDTLATDPSDKQMIGLIAGLEYQLKRRVPSAAGAKTDPNPDPQQQLKQLKADFDQGKMDQPTYDQKKSAILNSL